MENETGTAVDRNAFDCLSSTFSIDPAVLAAEATSTLKPETQNFLVRDHFSYFSEDVIRNGGKAGFDILV